MPCKKPLTAWREHTTSYNYKTPVNRRRLVFDEYRAELGTEMQIPCGQCIGCRLEYSRTWAVRCMDENEMHDEGFSACLTYEDEYLPEKNSLRPRDTELFIKRLRRELNGKKIRYFLCGEYGEKNERPHYHILLWGYIPADLYKTGELSKSGYPLYRSDNFEEQWRAGRCDIGEVTFESAAYVARYMLKKINGDKADEHYKGREKEFLRMSQGIGLEWYKKYRADVYPDGLRKIRGGKICKSPKYYDMKEMLDHEMEVLEMKQRRLEQAKNSEKNKPSRIHDATNIIERKQDRIKRC